MTIDITNLYNTILEVSSMLKAPFLIQNNKTVINYGTIWFIVLVVISTVCSKICYKEYKEMTYTERVVLKKRSLKYKISDFIINLSLILMVCICMLSFNSIIDYI